MRQQWYLVPYQDAPSPPMTPALRAACEKAVHVLLPGGTVLRAGRAALTVLELLGWKRTARLLLCPPLLWFVEIGYWIVAHNRSFFARLLFTREKDEKPRREEG